MQPSCFFAGWLKLYNSERYIPGILKEKMENYGQ